MAGVPYELIYDAEVSQHLAAIDSRHYSLIRQTIEQHLRHEPGSETKNRKPLLRPTVFGESWEIRFGPANCFRVFYRFNSEERVVRILAVGIKVGNELRIGGEVFEL